MPAKNIRLSLASLALLAMLPNPTSGQDAKSAQSLDPLTKFVQNFEQAVNEDVVRFYAAGGKVGAPENPAARWAAVLFEFGEAYPGKPIAAEAASRAMWMLQHAGLNEEMFQLAQQIPLCDPRWEGILEPLSYAADGPDRENRLIQKTLTLQANCNDPAERATAAYTRAILYHRRGEIGQAKAALGEALRENTDSAARKKAHRLLFEITSLNVGQAAPAFSANTTHNRTIRLEDFRGKVVLLNFWSSTCSPCVAEFPLLQELEKSCGANLVIIGISGGVERKQLDDMVIAKKVDWTQVFDGKGFDGDVFSLYNVLGTPTNIVLDRTGKIVFRDFGSGRESELRKAINDAL
jgi:thiol-disulfide isomerase/thioredoxin